jgi:hypothetical protein
MLTLLETNETKKVKRLDAEWFRTRLNLIRSPLPLAQEAIHLRPFASERRATVFSANAPVSIMSRRPG